MKQTYLEKNLINIDKIKMKLKISFDKAIEVKFAKKVFV